MATFDRYHYETSTESWKKIGIVKLESEDIRNLTSQRLAYTDEGEMFPVCDVITTSSIELSVGGDLESVVAALSE